MNRLFLILAAALVLAGPAAADHDVAPAASAAPAAPAGSPSGIGQALVGDGQSEFLDPDIAFVPSVEVRDAHTLVARWRIADGYYLYRDKLGFELGETGRAKLAAARLPPGQIKRDEFFGRVAVLYHEAEALLPLERTDPRPTEVALRLHYQGCADAGLCYPPMTREVALSLPAAASSAGGEGGPGAGVLSEQDRIARALAADSPWLIMAMFLGFGLLLAFTPCVFPMIPILSGIIVGQGTGVSTRRALGLSGAFVLAMAVTYAGAGVAAGLFGQNLQATLQNPWVLGAFSALFVLLALAMFGVYQLQLPSAWQSRLSELSARQRGGTYAGAAIMGLLSALIVGPCVAAPLAGALVYIGHTGDAVLGGFALFTLALGMGLPLLIAGASAGHLLPRAGAWMRQIRAVFGVMLLAVAVYLLERIVPGWAALLLWAALLVGAAVHLGMLGSLPARPSGWQRLRKAAGLAVAAYAAVLVVSAAGGGEDPLQPLHGVSFAAGEREVRAPAFKPVSSLEDLEAQLAAASAAGRPVVLEYYADWCVTCKQLERYTFSDPQVRSVLADAVLLRSDVTAYDEQDRALLERFQLFGPPAILFFGADGAERSRYRLVGFMDARAFHAHARDALS